MLWLLFFVATAYGYGSPSGARGQRKREAAARPAAASKSPKKKPAAKKSAVKKGGLKKAGTMVKTAKVVCPDFFVAFLRQ